VLSVSVALATAAAMARRHFRGRTVLEAGLLAPMVLPGVALGVGMLAVFRLTPLWGSRLSLAMAHSTLAIPVAYLVLRGALRQVDPNLEAAARGLGAGPWRTFRFVTLPLAMPAVLAATLFGVVISLNEITVTLFLATRYTETLPRVIWPNLRFAITPLAAAASVVLLGLTLPAVIIALFRTGSQPRRKQRDHIRREAGSGA
jgi:ABC-type spermidine/putrescine transport system permease subunit II